MVNAGLMWAPDRRPHGETTMQRAVMPMAIPMHARRAESLAITVENGDAGAKSSVPKRLAEIMNVPRPQASIMYSGQCSCRVRDISRMLGAHPPVANPGEQVMPPSSKSEGPVM